MGDRISRLVSWVLVIHILAFHNVISIPETIKVIFVFQNIQFFILQPDATSTATLDNHPLSFEHTSGRPKKLSQAAPPLVATRNSIVAMDV